MLTHRTCRSEYAANVALGALPQAWTMPSRRHASRTRSKGLFSRFLSILMG